jgi:transcriptional regulator with XRE-family HTH domain
MVGDLQRIVGDNLRAQRKAQGLTQEAFALAMDVHRTWLGDVERGERNISLQKLERIALVLEVEPRSLLDDP